MERERHQFVAFLVLSCLITTVGYMFYINSPRSYYASTSYVDQMYASQNDVQNLTIDTVQQNPTMQYPTIHVTQHSAQPSHTDIEQLSTTINSVQSIPTDAIQHSVTVDTIAIEHTSADSVSWTSQPASPTADNDSISAPSLPVSLTKVCTGYDGASRNFATKDLIVRAAYFDDRRRGRHRNTIVFLIEVRISVLKLNLIIGCAVGEHWTKKFEVHRLKLTGWVHHHHSELSHDTVFVDCFDLPVQNGSRAFVLYRRPKHNFITCVESERPVMIPAPHLPLARHQTFSVAICCAPVYGVPPLLTEWLRYQKTIAADHVHLIVEDSFVKAGGLDNKQLKQAMQEGFVTMDVWKPWLNKRQVYYHSQVLAHEDCIYRLRGTYDYVMLLDLDEFFTPRVVGQTKIHYYVEKCCGYQWCGSCHFHEYMYYPDCGLNGEAADDGNITRKLVSYKHLDQAAQGKSVHRSAAIVETGCQRGNEHIRGYRSIEFPLHLAYVAHIRKGKKPSKGKC